MPAVRVGVDLGGTKCLGVALVRDGDGWSVVDEERVPTPTGGAAILETITEVIRRLGRAGPVASAGVGIPGLVDRNGEVWFTPNLVGVGRVPVVVPLRERLGIEVWADNDATCAAWAEHLVGAARGAGTCVVVTLGTGIGGGFVVDGALERGANGFAGEIGHMVVDPDGPRCPCGRRGCWERFASGSGMAHLAREAARAGHGRRFVELAGGDLEAIRGEHVTAAAREGDPDALAVLDDFGRWIAIGLANLVVILDPSLVVLGGGVMVEGDLVLGPTRRWFPEVLSGGASRPDVPIVPATLGERAGAIGAALLGATAR